MQGFEETPLEPGAFVWFTPGTIHRLVNDGDLEILVLMANAGLPEAGDMVITFEPDVVADAERYAEAATLPDDDRTTAGPGDAARLRRDAAVPEFLRLAEAVERRRHDRAAAVPRRGRRARPPAAARLGRDLAGRPAGRGRSHRRPAHRPRHRRRRPPRGRDRSARSLRRPHERRMGCCGTLGTYVALQTDPAAP